VKRKFYVRNLTQKLVRPKIVAGVLTVVATILGVIGIRVKITRL
jgi:hypothetical protein